MLAQQYAHALYELTKDADALASEQYANKLKALLKARGHEMLYPRIVHAYEALVAQEKEEAAKVRINSEDDLNKHKEEIVRVATEMGLKGQTLKPVIDKTLIGGFRIDARDASYDASYKRTLINMYRTLVT